MSRQGRHGEAFFTALCQRPDAKVDAVLNPAANDLHGWDFVIDISPLQNSALPFDLQTHLLQCFAQIKTTNGKRPATKVKVSNAVKAAKSPFPSFIFLFHYSDSSSEPILYARHIWKGEIEESLRLARKYGNESVDLRKKYLSFTFSEADKIRGNPIDWVLDEIELKGGGGYAANKLGIAESVGYEGSAYEGKFEVGPLKEAGDVVLHEIGLIDDLPMKNYQLFDTRFGMKSIAPIDAFESGRVSFSSEGKPLILRITAQDGTTFTIPGLGWVPRLVGIDHPEFRVRVQAGHIEIVIQPKVDVHRINCRLDSVERYPFLEQLGFIFLSSWMKQGPVSFKVETDIGEIFAGAVTEVPAFEPWVSQLEVTGSYLLNILGREKCSEVSLSYDEFSNLSKDIYFVANIFRTGSFKFSATFDSVIDPFDRLVGYFYGKFGPWAFGVVHEIMHFDRSADGMRQTFYFRDSRVVSSFAYKQPVSSAREQAKGEFEKYVSTLSAPVAKFYEGDIVAWTKAYSEDQEIELSVD